MRHVHGEATECDVFMGRQRNASCSSGGNGTRGSQPAGSERNAWSCSSGGLGRNKRWKQGIEYHTMEETDVLHSERGPVDWEGSGVPQNGGNGPPTVEMGVLLTGGVWRTAKRRKRTKRTSYGRNRGPVDREGCGVPQNGGNGPPTVETGVLLIGRGVAYCKTDETDLCWSATVETGVLFIRRGVAYRKTGLHEILFISTIDPSSLHELLFIHHRPPPASTCDWSSTGSCSSSLHRALLHRLLFNHPSTVYYSSSIPHHGVLFNHPSTGTPPPSTVHPALHHTTGSCSSRGNATAHCSSKPPHNAHCSSHRSASVSSSQGIARSGSVNSHRSTTRVQ